MVLNENKAISHYMRAYLRETKGICSNAMKQVLRETLLVLRRLELSIFSIE